MLRLLNAARREIGATRPEGRNEAEPSRVSPGLTVSPFQGQEPRRGGIDSNESVDTPSRHVPSLWDSKFKMGSVARSQGLGRRALLLYSPSGQILCACAAKRLPISANPALLQKLSFDLPIRASYH